MDAFAMVMVVLMAGYGVVAFTGRVRDSWSVRNSLRLFMTAAILYFVAMPLVFFIPFGPLAARCAAWILLILAFRQLVGGVIDLKSTTD